MTEYNNPPFFYPPLTYKTTKPPDPAYHLGAPSKYPFGSMSVCDSFDVDPRKKISVYQCARSWAMIRGIKWRFSVKKDADGIYRCRRME